MELGQLQIMFADYKKIIINEILLPSLNKLYDVDYANISYGVSERNICARLALHMECLMRQYDESHDISFFSNYYADVEYNRMGKGELKQFENHEQRQQYMVSDLLIHSRGYDNLLTIEMKRKGYYKNAKSDRNRLKSMVSDSLNGVDNCVHNTLIGAFIIYSPDDVKIELYEKNINGCGEKTEVQRLLYTSNISGAHLIREQ